MFLVYDSNTLYLDEEQTSHTSDGIYMTQSYACGSVFTVSVLDFLASAVRIGCVRHCLSFHD
jgi:hypothetical protein